MNDELVIYDTVIDLFGVNNLSPEFTLWWTSDDGPYLKYTGVWEYGKEEPKAQNRIFPPTKWDEYNREIECNFIWECDVLWEGLEEPIHYKWDVTVYTEYTRRGFKTLANKKPQKILIKNLLENAAE